MPLGVPFRCRKCWMVFPHPQLLSEHEKKCKRLVKGEEKKDKGKEKDKDKKDKDKYKVH
jgi:hypothetical protein